MASYINMSLDDIIQKKKRENMRTKSKMKQLPSNMKNIGDARNKIISKKRTQITDAREKLAELAKRKDARLKLEQIKAKKATKKFQGGLNTYRKFMKQQFRKDRAFTDLSRQVVSQPLTAKPMRKQNFQNKKFFGNRSIEAKSFVKPSLKPIIRTVENDLEIVDDAMEGGFDSNRVIMNRTPSLQFKIVTHNNEASRSFVKEKSPPRPPSILKKRPIAALRTENKPEMLEKLVPECRIIVSNLRNTVTAGDIQELFNDVGGMVESRLVRPGTAEVIYKTVEDAQRAVDLYHNRQLDKQPMNCLLVTPRATNPAPTSSTHKPALYSTNSNVEPDILTFHKVLFNSY